MKRESLSTPPLDSKPWVFKLGVIKLMLQSWYVNYYVTTNFTWNTLGVIKGALLALFHVYLAFFMVSILNLIDMIWCCLLRQMCLYAGALCVAILLFGRMYFVLQFPISSSFLFYHLLLHLFPIFFFIPIFFFNS